MRSIFDQFGGFVLLVTILFWQGGFMFYGGVVVPVGSTVLGSDTQQGFITQAVTNYLNLAGFVCLTAWAVSLWRERTQGVTKLEWVLLCFNTLLLISLVLIHREMDLRLDTQTTSVTDPIRFGWGHKAYIGTSSLQWLTSLLMLHLLMLRWGRSDDRST